MSDTSSTQSAAPRGYAFVAASALAFGLLPILLSLISKANTGAAVQVVSRLIVGVLFLLVWNLIFRNGILPAKHERNPSLILFNGFTLLAAFLTYNISIKLGTPPVKAILLVYTSPILTIFLSAMFLGEKLNIYRVLATIAGVTGVFIAMGFWRVEGLLEFGPGDFFALANSLFTTLLLILGRRTSTYHETNPLVSLQWSLTAALALAVLIGIPVWLISPGNPVLWAVTFNGESLLSLVGLGLFGTVLPYVLLYSGLRYLQASRSALVLLLEPVTVFVLQMIILRQPVEWWQVVGGMVILGAGLLARKES